MTSAPFTGFTRTVGDLLSSGIDLAHVQALCNEDHLGTTHAVLRRVSSTTSCNISLEHPQRLLPLTSVRNPCTTCNWSLALFALGDSEMPAARMTSSVRDLQSAAKDLRSSPSLEAAEHLAVTINRSHLLLKSLPDRSARDLLAETVLGPLLPEFLQAVAAVNLEEFDLALERLEVSSFLTDRSILDQVIAEHTAASVTKEVLSYVLFPRGLDLTVDLGLAGDSVGLLVSFLLKSWEVKNGVYRLPHPVHVLLEREAGIHSVSALIPPGTSLATIETAAALFDPASVAASDMDACLRAATDLQF